MANQRDLAIGTKLLCYSFGELFSVTIIQKDTTPGKLPYRVQQDNSSFCWWIGEQHIEQFWSNELCAWIKYVYI